MTKQISFNLADEGWLKCQWLGNQYETKEIGLRQLLVEAHHIEQIAEEYPTVLAGLYRILLSILHHEFGPKSRKDWEKLWETGCWDAKRINDYFDVKYPGRFDLFHSERPFLQVADMNKVENPVIRLFHHMNSPTLFDHTIEEAFFTPVQAAKGLLAFQTYSLAHGPGIRPSFDGNASRDVSFFLQGKNLFETLLLNMPVYPANDPIPTMPRDAPCWAQDNPFRPQRGSPFGYLDYLTWQIRRVRLLPEQMGGQVVVQKMMVMPAPKLTVQVRDPFKLAMLNRETGNELTARFDQERMLWRDSVVLFSLHDIPEKYLLRDGRPPYTFEWLAKMRDFLGQRRNVFNYQALGMATRSGQNKVHFYRGETMPVPLDYFESPQLVQKLQMACELAEAAAVELRWATFKLIAMLYYPSDAQKLWSYLSKDIYEKKSRRDFWRMAFGTKAKQNAKEFIEKTYGEVWCIERTFWTDLALPFKEFMLDLPQKPEQALSEWTTILYETVRIAFQIVEQRAGYSVSALKTIATIEKEFEKGLKFALDMDLDKE